MFSLLKTLILVPRFAFFFLPFYQAGELDILLSFYANMIFTWNHYLKTLSLKIVGFIFLDLSVKVPLAFGVVIQWWIY